MKKNQQFTKFKIAALSAIVLSMNAYAEVPPVAETEKPVVEQIVNTLTKLSSGPHTGYRANHAKGIVVLGEFTPAKSAAKITKAVHLQGKSSPVIVRFSDATGVPNIADADGNAFPKGIAIRFKLTDDSYTDIVSIRPMAFLPVSQKIF